MTTHEATLQHMRTRTEHINSAVEGQVATGVHQDANAVVLGQGVVKRILIRSRHFRYNS